MAVRVFVIERTVSLRRMIHAVLSESDSDYVVASTSDTTALQDTVQLYGPDLILLGLSLRRHTDGLGLCRQLRTNPHTAHTPVIMLYAQNPGVGEATMRDAGASACIVKQHFTPSVLESAIKDALASTG